MFPNLLKVAEHLTIKLLENLSYIVRLHFLALNNMDFTFLGEHFKTAGGALVVPGAVVGNHWSKALTLMAPSTAIALYDDPKNIFIELTS